MRPSINTLNQVPPPSFTDWQITIIRKWAEETSSEAAATALGISTHTFHTHLKRMRAKLGVKRTFDVYFFLSREGFV